MNPGEANRPDASVLPASLEAASAMATRALGRSVAVLGRAPLAGGKINAVEVWQLEGNPGEVVVKVDLRGQTGALAREAAYLRYLKAETSLPVPEPLGLLPGAQPEGAGEALFLQRLTGRHMGLCTFSAQGETDLQVRLADTFANLHRHTRRTFGKCIEAEGSEGWVEDFRGRLEAALTGAAPRLESELVSKAGAIVERLDDLLETDSVPAMIHGDLWANNIIVDDRDPDRPTLSGLVDPRGEFCDAEFELAYLNCFGPEWERFIARYREHHPERPGFLGRCRVYWLHSMLVHVWIFGAEKFIRRAGELTAQIHSKIRAKQAQ